ncbi:Asp-tRNAAsn/Glu-tRNAGln amidotransferase A subunit and related amidase [Polynucleobacter duraquae]|uniref:Asp-tRNAAsn/Glu-tRNAGln amidotransferase A subunit and related amidase n=1 Tax=Polynucleobacter duraquae TaxID=1835254 RepID=A0A0E3V1A1_9BURK|nr:amidase [Polynucleobacter duraquae]AKD25313.1 Asp-tRNAAsn/Glu-tRNAGln amidotransferase A subunit and related amidase [Polynucleobacter duraquae]
MKPAIGLLQACEQIQQGQLKVDDYLAECVERADQVEPELKAFTVRASLKELYQRSGLGPLMGIPVAVKDIIATKDFVTTNGSPIYKDFVPSEDAEIIKKIRNLGGVIFGKTVTTEFAWRHAGATTNPWNSAHTPGGSSSGSAAAVASGIVPLSLGSQTAGSIIRPASYCGVVGYKASFGAVPRKGVHPVSDSLDHIGFFTRSVADARYAFNLLRNTEINEKDAIVIPEILSKPLSEELGNQQPRIAYLKTPFDELLSQEQIKTVNHAATLLKQSGAHIEEITLPQMYWDGIEALAVLMACEAALVHEKHLEQYPELLGFDIKELIEKGRSHSMVDYLQAKDLQANLRLSISQDFKNFDAILAAPATGEAPQGLSFTGNPIFCSLWSFIGTPAVALPVRKSSNGLPLGIQLVGNYREDEKLLNIAEFAEMCFKVEG